MSYFQKYLKYKHKYLVLKQQYQNQTGGADIELDSLSDSELDQIEKQIKFELKGGAEDTEASDASSQYTATEDNTESEQPEENNEETTEEDSSSEESEEESDEEKKKKENNTEENAVTETDSELSSTDSLDQEGGGRFFNHVMDQLSSSVRSFDLQKGTFDSELSSLSEFNL